MAKKDVPQSALHFTATEFTLGDNGESAKTAPFRMVARSGQPIEHWYWGKVAHDLSGMRLHKQRVSIDYAHDDKEVIGYANAFSSESGDLEVSGALVPFKDSDRATEVIYKQKSGVPYEASINFGGDGIKLEQVAEGQSAQVNGYTFDGPGIVIREWPLRGIAVCPYGADMNTSTQFAASKETVTVEFMEANMADEQTNVPEENQQPAEVSAVEVEQVADTDTPAETEAVAEVVEAPAETTELTSRAAQGKLFMDAFGDRGAVWFAQGKSYEEAQLLCIKEQRERIQQLEQQLSASQSFGEADPVEFSDSNIKKPQRLVRIAGKRYDD